jgi:hypothetical protein
VQYLQALATPSIALLVAVIGVLQWRTAHQRAVLDLFDRRMNAYEGIRRALSRTLTSGQTDDETVNEFSRAISRVPFMFGPDVVRYLEELKKALSTHYTLSEQMIESAPESERTKYVKAKGDAFLKISSFYDDFTAVIKPYVRMHQKAPRF